MTASDDDALDNDWLANGGTRSPMEGHSGYRGDDWSPERLAFHQNLEQFAERVGLIVGLQGNGKVSQEQAYAEIKAIWKSLKDSKNALLESDAKR
ncbi:MAG: hypothetical protein WBM08_04565 [Prochlorococcaceae cyanobacterium]